MARGAAAQSNNGDVPLGGRSTLLGGTGVALGKDGSSPFLNPATMGRIADHRLAFSVNFYRYTFSQFDQFARAPAGVSAGPEGVSQGTFGGLPGSFCAFVTISGIIPEEAAGLWQAVRGHSGRTKLGLCGATIEREQFVLDAESRSFADGLHRARTTYNVEHVWQRQSIGPSLSYQLTERLTLGATFQVATTSARQIWDLAAVVDDSNGRVYQHRLVGSAISGVTTLGVVWTERPLTLGASARLPSVNFRSSALLSDYIEANSQPRLATGTGSFAAQLPPTVTIGTGAEWERFSIEFDTGITLPTVTEPRTTLDLDAGGNATRTTVMSSESVRPSVAWRIGAEHHLSPTLTVLLGARYEPTSVRYASSSLGYRLGPLSRNIVACSAGIGSYGKGMELLFGLELSHSSGRIPMVAELGENARYVEAKLQSTSALLVLSGSVGLSEVKRTWDNFRQLKSQSNP